MPSFEDRERPRFEKLQKQAGSSAMVGLGWAGFGGRSHVTTTTASSHACWPDLITFDVQQSSGAQITCALARRIGGPLRRWKTTHTAVT